MKKKIVMKSKLSLQKNTIANLIADPQMIQIVGGATTDCSTTDPANPISVVVACTTLRTVTRTNTSTVE